MKKSFRMLALWDYNTFTGFATVSKNLVAHWKTIFGDSMKLDIVAINYFGESYNEGANIRVISGKVNDVAKDDFGRYVFMRSIADVDYDVVFIMQDLGVVVPMIPHIKKILEDKKAANKKQFKSIVYFPVDFALTPNLAVGLEFFNTLITYTEYGRSHVLRLKPELKGKLKVIPHGHNMNEFYPLRIDKIKEFRKEYFGDNADKFIIGSVNRNQSRKDIPTTIFGFLEYWDNYNKNSFLYLHMNPKDPMGWHLRTILAQTPLVEGRDFMFPPTEDFNKGADVAKMNKIYNSLDVFLSTATGEGWGLTITEAMACEVPVIAPNHTSIAELSDGGKRMFLLETQYPVVAMVDNVVRFQSDIYEIADVIYNLYLQTESSSVEIHTRVNKAYEFVENLDWKGIAAKFAEEIKTLV